MKKPKLSSIQHIVLSRTDAIGDVVLSLPLAGWLKQVAPHIKISFLGRSYTEDLIKTCPSVDQFLNWDQLKTFSFSEKDNFFLEEAIDMVIHIFPVKEIASFFKRGGVQWRVGTSHRVFHWWTCNRLPSFNRKNSDMHESQLNFELLRATFEDIPKEFCKGISLNDLSKNLVLEVEETSLDPIFLGLNIIGEESSNQKIVDKKIVKQNLSRKKIIVHPGSHLSAKNWPLEVYMQLIAELLKYEHVDIFLTGTEKEGEIFRPYFKGLSPHVFDVSGKMSLKEFMGFIKSCDAFFASSTGPLHIASALGLYTYGLFTPLRPTHPGRWAPLGEHTYVFVDNRINCTRCRSQKICECILNIHPTSVASKIAKDLKRVSPNGQI